MLIMIIPQRDILTAGAELGISDFFKIMTLGADFQESDCLESLSIPFFGISNSLKALKMGILGPDNPEMGARCG